MIIVRHSEDRDSFVDFLFAHLVQDFRRDFPELTLTIDAIRRATASWDVLEFFDTDWNVIVGVGCRESNNYIHTYVDRNRRLRRWSPHKSLQAMYDIFLADRDALYTAIPSTDGTSNKLALKLGFVLTTVKHGLSFYKLTPETRRLLRDRAQTE